MVKRHLLVDGMQGLGDNVYQYPIIKELAARQSELYLTTSWPQLYADIPGVKFHRSLTKLRTQRKNVLRNASYYSLPKIVTNRIRLNYVAEQSRGTPLYQGLIAAAGLGKFNYFLKVKDRCPERKNYAVIRPPTIRTEWKALSRNPDPLYIHQAVQFLASQGLHTVVLADIEPPYEVYAPGARPPAATTYYERGQLSFLEMVKLIHEARVVVGGVGFIAPLCIALGTPAVIIHGGAGGWNAPELIDAPGEGKLHHVLPIKYCRCRDHNHNCDKTIDRFEITKALQQALL